MKALTFLEFMQKIDKSDYVKDYYYKKLEKSFSDNEIKFYEDKGIILFNSNINNDNYYFLNITKALEFWNQKPTIELIKGLFKFKGSDDKYSRLYLPENEQKIKYITLTNNMVFKNDNLAKTYKTPYPSTLDMFISNCRQCNIDLEWK